MAAFVKGNTFGKGRPKGAISKPRLSDYLTEKEILAIVGKAKELALQGNEAMIKLITDHHFGKPRESIDHTSGGKELPQPLFKIDVLRNNSPTQDSQAI